jgi:transitional endoplasmic reticulum ATPase
MERSSIHPDNLKEINKIICDFGETKHTAALHMSSKLNKNTISRALKSMLNSENDKIRVEAIRLIKHMEIHDAGKILCLFSEAILGTDSERMDCAELLKELAQRAADKFNDENYFSSTLIHILDFMLNCLFEKSTDNAKETILSQICETGTLMSKIKKLNWRYYKKIFSENDFRRIAESFYDLNEFSNAELLCSIALTIDPLEAETYFLRAMARNMQNNFNGALEDYKHSLTLCPQQKEVFNNIGDLYYWKAQRSKEEDKNKNYHEALNQYRHAVCMAPDYFKAIYNMGLTLANLERYQQAYEAFTKAIAIMPDHAETYHLRGICLENLGRKSDAKKDFSDAVRYNPGLKEELADKFSGKSGADGEEGQVSYAENIIQYPTETFSDIVGMDNVKGEILSILIDPLRNVELANRYCIDRNGEIFLYGPPGCGKSLVCRAAAGQCKAMGQSVTYYPIDLTILSKWVGESENAIHSVFEHAVAHSPSLIFIDEIDALAAERDSFLCQGYERKIICQLLIELSKLENSSKNTNVLVCAASNNSWAIDPAILRSGRLGTACFLPGPDISTRENLFRHFLSKRPVDTTIDYRELAIRTDGHSIASIKNICLLAAKIPWKAALNTQLAVPISMQHLLASITSPDLSAWYQKARENNVRIAGSGFERKMGFHIENMNLRHSSI